MRRRSQKRRRCCGPSLRKQLQNLGAAVVDVMTNGIVDTDVSETRLAVCQSCEHLRALNRCDLCGCFVRLKTVVPHEHCPAHKWAAYDNANWAVGMTTAPRRESTIRRALAGLRINGWEPTIFAEPGSDLDGIDAPIVNNPVRLGVWHNWVQQATSLIDWYPEATHILTMQDDCELVPGARALIDGFEWPEDAAFVSLYLPLKETQVRVDRQRVNRTPGIQPIAQNRLHGSLALAFPRRVLEAILRHPEALSWSGRRRTSNMPRHLQADDDICIGRCVIDMGLRMYYAVPSCSQHVAEFSAREGGGNNAGVRHAAWVARNAFEDCRSVETV